jgi:hypothetical protein
MNVHGEVEMLNGLAPNAPSFSVGHGNDLFPHHALESFPSTLPKQTTGTDEPDGTSVAPAFGPYQLQEM